MKITKEFIAGVIVILLVALLVLLTTGVHGIQRAGIAILIAWITLYLLNRKSILLKTGTKILKPDLLVRFLMPRDYRNAIKELEETEEKD